MIDNIQLNDIAAEIRSICQMDSSQAAERVEKRLEAVFADYSPSRRKALLEELITCFNQNHRPSAPPCDVTSASFSKLLTMLLGKDVLQKDLSIEQMIEQLAAALNTVFDSVNTLISAINATLMGGVSGEETIRVVISSSMDKEEGIGSLEKYLEQIGRFFAIALQAYKEAAQVKIGEIMQELNPERIADESNSTLKFGPLRRAYLYDCYQEKFKTMQNWQNSGLLLEAFMKEFENNCRKLSQKVT